MSHRQIAVLRGGPSEEYQVSMSTGSEILSALKRLGYKAKDITITKQGEWLDGGRVRQPETILESVDLVLLRYMVAMVKMEKYKNPSALKYSVHW